MYISYDSYRIFYHAAQCGSFTQAALTLQSNQPNITRTIKQLEQQLGCRLFIRSNRGITLTPEGERLYARVSAAVLQIQAGEEELAGERSLESGIVSIGASGTALHVLLLPVLKEFHRTYPGIRILISNYSTPQAISALKSGRVDFAVVSTPTGITKPLRETTLLSYQDILAAGPDYAFLTKKSQTLQELQSYPLISLGRNTNTYEFYSSFYLRHGLSLKPDMETATVDQIPPLIKNNLGLAFVPEPFVAQELENGELCRIPLSESIPSRSICLINDTGKSLSTAARKLERMLLVTVEDLRNR